MTARVVIVGAGAWGTALALHLASRATAGPRVTLVFRDPVQAQAARLAGENRRYLPGIALPGALALADDLAQAAEADCILVATPVAGLVDAVRRLAATGARAPLAWLCKGFVTDAGGDGARLPHRAVDGHWPAPVAVVSGPSFAEEVARGLPTALAVASSDAGTARAIAGCLRSDSLRPYQSDDVAGVETGGAVKNVMAIAAGLADGLGFGLNARAALVTRGLAEIARLAVALGGRRETLMGLAGLGDLVLTATGDLSRNRRLGLALARGETLGSALAGLGHVAEGVGAARAARALAQRHGIEMPITESVDDVLSGRVPVRDAVAALLAREPGRE